MPITEQKLQAHRRYMQGMNNAGGWNRAGRLANREKVHTHQPRRHPTQWGRPELYREEVVDGRGMTARVWIGAE